MTDKKKPASHTAENHMGLETAATLSAQRRAREKSEAKNYARVDKRKEARIEHRNGSTPSERS